MPDVVRLLRSCGNELIHKELTAIGRVITRETGTCVPEQGDLGESACMAKNAEGREIPRWFTFPEVATELKCSYVPRHRQGISVFFTGLPGPGTSIVANGLMVQWLAMGGRLVTWLDGDLVRKHLSSTLGFSHEDQALHIDRSGLVIAEITKTMGSPLVPPSRHTPRSAIRARHGRTGRRAV